MGSRLNLINKTINSFYIIEELPNKKGRSFYKAICICGKTIKKEGRDFKRIKSCGCLKSNFKKVYKDFYGSWNSMKDRCHNLRSKDYAKYGGRGIVVCERWRNSFINFVNDIGPRPSLHHSVDRIDVNGNYEPSNCRWATPTQQLNNTRFNVRYIFFGESLTVSEAAKKFNIRRDTLSGRLKRNWKPDLAVSKSVRTLKCL